MIFCLYVTTVIATPTQPADEQKRQLDEKRQKEEKEIGKDEPIIKAWTEYGGNYARDLLIGDSTVEIK